MRVVSQLVEIEMQARSNFQTMDSAGQWIAGWLASELDIDPHGVTPDQSFLSYGMDSMHAMMLVGDLEGRLGVRLSPTLVWDYPTVAELAGFIVGQAACPPPAVDPAPNGVANLDAPASRPDPRTVLSQLDGMSEEEMDTLLQHFLDEPA
jgi:acyl carrier protein